MILLAAIVAALASSGSAQVTLPDPVYKVEIDAHFDPDTAQVHGVERLRWRNTSSVPVGELQFHLYLNGFADNRTTFMSESGGQLRGMDMPEDGWGWIEVESMRLAYAEDLAAAGLLGDEAENRPGEAGPLPLSPPVIGDDLSAELPGAPDLKQVEEIIQPDDGNSDDRTVARYPLPHPVQPGDWVEVDITFSSKLPQIFARSGVSGDYVLGGQWFPKIGVFEDSGERGRTEAGWNTHQYHADSEFYADFGDWDVRLTLPARYKDKIGATGQLVESSDDDGTVSVRFRQDGVHDFAWTADPDFIVKEEVFDPDTDVPPEQLERIATLLGLPQAALRLQPVTIRLMLQPAHRGQAQRYFGAAKAAIRGYGLRLGAYPYPTLTMVDPPRGAMGSGGMEYPTFITLGTHPALNLPGLRGLLFPEMVAVHEFGHNFFQGMSASNEFEEAWLDEGINSYYEMVVMEEAYGSYMDAFGMHMSSLDNNRLQLGAGRYTDPIDQTSWTYRSSGSYALNSYARPAVTLRHLEYLIGPETFARAMRTFFQTWRFHHPSTADFEAIMQAATDQDIGWFLHQALHTDRGLDYRIRTATSTKVKKPKGWFWEDGTRVLHGDDTADDDDKGDDESAAPADATDETTTDATDESTTNATDEATADEETGDDEHDLYRTEVVVERRLEFRHPVTVELVFADGERIRHDWDGQSRWTKITEIRPSKLVSAEVDPDHHLVLDVDPHNNRDRLEADPTPAAKILVNIGFWLQNLFELTSSLG